MVWAGALEEWALPGVWNFISEHLQNPEKLVEYLGKVCCRPGNPKEAQITAVCQGLAHTTELCSALFSILKGKRAGSADSAAASPTPGTDPAAAPILAIGPTRLLQAL